MQKMWNLLALVLTTLFLSSNMAAQTTFNFRQLVQTGDLSPAPPQLSSVSEFSFNDHGEIAVAADGGLLFTSGGSTSIVAGFGDAAPGGGTFIFADSPSLNSQGTLVFRGEVTFPSVSGLFQFSQGTITSLIPEGALDSDAEAGGPVAPQQAEQAPVAGAEVEDPPDAERHVFEQPSPSARCRNVSARAR